MKISKLFHWLYASLMFLPLVVAPIFAIYSHRHTIDNFNVITQEDSHYNLRQLVFNGFPFNTQFYSSDDHLSFSDDYGRDSILVTSNDVYNIHLFYNQSATYDFAFSTGDTIYLSFDFKGESDDTYSVSLAGGDEEVLSSFVYVASNSFTHFSCYFENIPFLEDTFFTLYNTTGDGGEMYFNYFQIFNITSIFGSGNEPTLSEFESLLTLDYYEYGVDYDIVYGTHNVTYNDSDIGSQFIYQLYNVEKNYFNFTSVFGLNAFGNWLYQNWFNSASYIGFYMFYYLFTYWLVISICWLLFDLLMYVPNLAHRWLDKGALE